MREFLPKIIAGVVLVAVIGGGAMMVTRHKNTVPAPVDVPGVAESVEAPPVPSLPPVVAQVQENRKYKRDMLDYDDTAPVVAKVAPVPAQKSSSVAVYGAIPGVPPGTAGTVKSIPPSVAPAKTAEAILQTDRLANKIRLASTQMKAGERISLYYTCNQKNVSPPLSWSGAPPATKSFVVMMEGPDKNVGQALHWGVYNIPESQASLDEAVPKTPLNEKGIGQVKTEMGPVGYAGPCIPRGQGTFVFSVYALDTDLKLHGGATRNELINAMNGHVIDMAKLPVTHYFRL